MKRVVAITLICMLCFQCFVKIGIFGYYLINRNYIATVLCINRDKPQMLCNGKCHLKKQLQKEDEQERKLPSGLSGNLEIPLFLNEDPVISLASFAETSQIGFFNYSSVLHAGSASDLFRPPQSA